MAEKIVRMVYIGNSKRIPVGEAKKFSYPVGDEKGTERPGILIHLEEGFVAYDALCTHLQAEVEWNRYTGKIWCTLHDGIYDPKTGKPQLGMPKHPLRKIELKIEENGDIYALI
ncbi:MAG: Rieske (2Fe-2S) protein [Nitrososphaerota archaeon]|nr:Rieske (2Fe-2S) protein [Candidatus Bathyarchaeota archaeon]MDW8049398.1 Rieske (2Fe-2S) protein [Nitrososphaerota archaeon]